MSKYEKLKKAYIFYLLVIGLPLAIFMTWHYLQVFRMAGVISE